MRPRLPRESVVPPSSRQGDSRVGDPPTLGKAGAPTPGGGQGRAFEGMGLSELQMDLAHLLALARVMIPRFSASRRVRCPRVNWSEPARTVTVGARSWMRPSAASGSRRPRPTSGFLGSRPGRRGRTRWPDVRPGRNGPGASSWVGTPRQWCAPPSRRGSSAVARAAG